MWKKFFTMQFKLFLAFEIYVITEWIREDRCLEKVELFLASNYYEIIPHKLLFLIALRLLRSQTSFFYMYITCKKRAQISWNLSYLIYDLNFKISFSVYFVLSVSLNKDNKILKTLKNTKTHPQQNVDNFSNNFFYLKLLDWGWTQKNTLISLYIENLWTFF